MNTGSNRMSSRRGELQFLRRELVEEAAALRDIAADLLAPEADQVLAGLRSQIDAILKGRPGDLTRFGCARFVPGQRATTSPDPDRAGWKYTPGSPGYGKCDPSEAGAPRPKSPSQAKPRRSLSFGPSSLPGERRPTSRGVSQGGKSNSGPTTLRVATSTFRSLVTATLPRFPRVYRFPGCQAPSSPRWRRLSSSWENCFRTFGSAGRVRTVTTKSVGVPSNASDG